MTDDDDERTLNRAVQLDDDGAEPLQRRAELVRRLVALADAARDERARSIDDGDRMSAARFMNAERVALADVATALGLDAVEELDADDAPSLLDELRGKREQRRHAVASTTGATRSERGQ